VDVFARSESTALLQAHLPTLPEGQAHQLADALGDLPLALVQAVGVLAETAMPATEYLQLLDTTPDAVLDEGVPLSYPRSLAKALRIAVDHLTDANAAAVQLLRLCAFLAPEPIPTRCFTAVGSGILPEPLATTVAAPLAYRRALGVISRYGLAKLTDDRIGLHRLTQRLIRADTPNRDHTITTVSHMLAALSPGNPNDPATWPAWADLLPHLRTLDLAGTVDEKLAWQAGRAVFYLLRRGEVRAGLAMIEPLFQAWLERFGPDARPSLWAASYLGQALNANGRHRQAADLEQDLLVRLRAQYGDDHPETLTAAKNLARDLRALGEHQRARDLDEDTLTRRRRVLGDDHPDTLVSAKSLARDLTALGELQQARSLGEDTLARWRRAFGNDHRDTLGSADSLARVLSAMGEHEQARDLDEDILTRRRRVLGDDHPDTLGSANNLAREMSALGEHQHARNLSEDTLTRYRRVLDDDHPCTLLTASNLAADLSALGMHADAEQWRTWVSERRRNSTSLC
jgi:hypothetical protein